GYGDLVVSSGLGGVYPKGINIGRIREIAAPAYETSLVLQVQPIIDFDRLEYLFMIEPEGQAAAAAADAAPAPGALLPGASAPAGAAAAPVAKPAPAAARPAPARPAPAVPAPSSAASGAAPAPAAASTGSGGQP
ncbi:MAG TPA: rod shape-determining protein MreC, partial [Spirochaetia bacterium]|nr:rod shape-determining protein MreC [Spirochaetia bacterium]